MSSRYENANIVNNSKKIDSDGTERFVRRLETVLYPDFNNLVPNDTYILSQQGDRLDILAKEFYGDEVFWHVIAKANQIGHGTLIVPPGRIIRIPYYDDYQPISRLIKELNERR
jgi:nucleoid-associated protein YgaU